MVSSTARLDAFVVLLAVSMSFVPDVVWARNDKQITETVNVSNKSTKRVRFRLADYYGPVIDIELAPNGSAAYTKVSKWPNTAQTFNSFYLRVADNSQPKKQISIKAVPDSSNRCTWNIEIRGSGPNVQGVVTGSSFGPGELPVVF